LAYPTAKKTIGVMTGSQTLAVAGHSTRHQELKDTVEALEDKVGIDSSADTNSIDYKLKSTSSSNPGHKHTLANGATDVTITAAQVNSLQANGVLGYKEITSDSTTTTTPTIVDPSGFEIAVTVPAGGRKIKVTVFAPAFSSSSSGAKTLMLYIREGSTTLQTAFYDQTTTTYAVPVLMQAILPAATATAGSHTYKVSMSQSAAGTLKISAGATYPAYILVEYLGGI
jgi:hypothetical protein